MKKYSSNNGSMSISVGAAWMLSVRLSIKSLGLISSIVLARLLMPEDFGIVALSMAVYALVRLIREFGFGSALIQNQRADRSHYDTAWTLQCLLSMLAALLLLVLGPYAADFYEDPRLPPVFFALAAMFFITGLENIGVVNFQKNMTFDKVFYVEVIPKVVSFTGTLVLAFYLRNYWALVYGMLINKTASLVVGYMMHSYRPTFSLKAWRSLFGFSSWLMINNVIKYLNRHGQNFILAKVGGAPLVGLVSVATEFASIVATEVIQPINTAAFPGYSKVSHDKKDLFDTFVNVFEAVSCVAIPGAIGIAALAPLFVPVLLGEKWISAVELMPYIAMASILVAMMNSFDILFMSIARQRITSLMVSLRILIFLPLMYILLVKYGAVGVAKAVLFSNLIIFPLYILALRGVLDRPLFSLISRVFRPAASAVVMYLVVTHFVGTAGARDLSAGGVAALLGCIASGVTIYVLSMWVTWKLSGSPRGIEERAVNFAKQKIPLLRRESI